GRPILAGVEMSTTWRGKVVHLLCYGFDPADNQLAGVASNVIRLQLENTQQVNEELQGRGYTFPRQQEVLAQNNGMLFRPIDNAILLREHGHARDTQEGIRMMREAGFRSILADLAETVDAAHRSGAICIFAHPGRSDSGFTYYTAEMLGEVRSEVPFDGVEVYHPYHRKEQVEMYLDYVTRNNLLLSTGSDTHCTAGRMPIKYRAETSRPLLERLGVTFE
ncbi:MAG: PHP domain-containing protein, partial [Ktedonobacteraceae bacterium]|nr:PHP domain-containing protein [Ktedonobacteraceae bacterium]